MSHRPIIDAGPGLNFLSIHQESPHRSLGEIECSGGCAERGVHKVAAGRAFPSCCDGLAEADPRWLRVLSDDETPELAAVVQRITYQPLAERLKRPKDLGEVMVIAHAVVAAEAGQEVTVLIDDGQGAQTATAEINRLERIRRSGRPVGSIKLVSTLTVLERAVQKEYIAGRADMRRLYQRLRELDDGLPPIEATSLLSPALWT